jgi:L-lactate dehydrogenase complex protein LldG
VSAARDAILGRIRSALLPRERAAHPGAFLGWRPDAAATDALGAFSEVFRKAGGEVVHVAGPGLARAWLEDFAAGCEAVAVGATFPADLLPDLRLAPPQSAALGISMAWGAVAETGTLVLEARDGRLTQLLPPVHVVLVRAVDVHATLGSALEALSGSLPSAVGLHSGPSKSADIGQILVTGVHGPGRVIALVVG